ncbi:LOW QUALITY PROTEIN: hypothetical protein MAR_016744 [Mya arenaria]|uniref:Retropepsins domain-containing protein n=1 Tax=Mya arenaria TaxID=6604 RepID=A0ABY7ED27_MYAAR|nr:LOW QUALITY PROTEIN: hypothetical protein MAR_016744 [Mya arenaria]
MATRLEAYKIADKKRNETIPVTAGLRTHDQRNYEGQYPQNCITNSTRQYPSTNPTTENKVGEENLKTLNNTIEQLTQALNNFTQLNQNSRPINNQEQVTRTNPRYPDRPNTWQGLPRNNYPRNDYNNRSQRPIPNSNYYSNTPNNNRCFSDYQRPQQFGKLQQVFLEVRKKTTATHMEQGPNSVRDVSGKSIHEGLFLPIQIQSHNIKALIDTGFNITLLHKNIFDSWPESKKPLIKPTSDILLVEVQTGKKKILYSLFLAYIANECIIGRDFMLSHNCDIILSRQVFRMNNEEFFCHTNELHVSPCRIAVTEDIEIPPDSEMVITGRTLDTFTLGTPGVTEMHQPFVEKHSVMLAKALVKP